jgi:FtsZ-binding cell division protein ZapB
MLDYGVKMGDLERERTELRMEVEAGRREMESLKEHESEVDKRMQDTRRSIEELMKVFCERVDEGDVERNILASMKTDMFHKMEAAKQESIGKKRERQMEELAEKQARMEKELQVKKEAVAALGRQPFANTESWKAHLTAHYAKMERMVRVFYCKAHLQDLMSLPEVLLEARVEIQAKTHDVWRRMMHPEEGASP